MKEGEPPPCRACGGKLRPWGRRRECPYSECLTCGSLLQTFPPTPAELEAMYAEVYVQNHGYSVHTATAHQPIYRRCADLLAKRFGPGVSRIQVLDFGCGWGGLCEELTRRNMDCLGIDLSKEEIEGCRARGLNCRLCGADELCQEGRKFDAVFAIFVLEHLLRFDTFFEQCDRLLKPNGFLVAAIPTAPLVRILGRLLMKLDGKREMPEFGHTIQPPWHTVIFSLPGLDALARRYGFRVSAFEPCPKYPSPLRWMNLIKRTLYAVERVGMGLFGRRWPVQAGALVTLSRLAEPAARPALPAA